MKFNLLGSINRSVILYNMVKISSHNYTILEFQRMENFFIQLLGYFLNFEFLLII